MILRQQLLDLIRRYLAADCSLEDLRDWLGSEAQAIADATETDPSLRRAAGRAWILLSELDADHLSETDVQQALSECLPMQGLEFVMYPTPTTSLANRLETPAPIALDLADRSRRDERELTFTVRL
jgi:hypothetical protein